MFSLGINPLGRFIIFGQYLTGNERVINLGEKVVVVFGNPQQHQQQNVGQNNEEG